MISLRQATMGDAELLLEMKNDLVMRLYSIETHDEIKMTDHLVWLKDNVQYTFMIEYDGEACGDIRIKDNEVAIKILYKYRGMGISTEVLKNVCEKNDFLTAKIVDGNVPSMRLFQKCGFKVVDHEDNYYILHYEKTEHSTS